MSLTAAGMHLMRKNWTLIYDEINIVNGKIKEGNQIFTDITGTLP